MNWGWGSGAIGGGKADSEAAATRRVTGWMEKKGLMLRA